MRLAFYAPLKPPHHATPSGDLFIARSLMAALERLGAQVDLASTLRSRVGDGDGTAQSRIIAAAEQEVPLLTAKGRQAGWQCWITYHNYYKAPDLIGPKVAAALNIPYVQIESTRARKRLIGPWATFARASEDASDAAQLIFYFTQHDAQALLRDAPEGQMLRLLRPFLSQTACPAPGDRMGPMLSVGMMRTADKLQSYKLIAQTLPLLPTSDWRLDIVGNGPAQGDIQTLFAPFGPAVRFLGQLAPDVLSQTYAKASLFFWPGVNEAFGLSYLEAQAHGLPVVAQDRPGVRDVLSPGTYPTIDAGPAGMAAALDQLLRNDACRRQQGDAARAHVATHHLLDNAAATLRDGLRKIGVPA